MTTTPHRRPRRSTLVLHLTTLPPLAMALWFGVLTLGEQVLGWTG